jgi:hypothetical protein
MTRARRAHQVAAEVTEGVERLRISGPSELLELVPYLLGFRPERSVVLLGLSSPRKRLVVTARFDLGTPAAAARPWFHTARREGCDECVLVVYDEAISGAPLPHRSEVRTWKTMARRHSLKLGDALAVGGNRWWSYVCKDIRCCPVEGKLLPSTGAVSAAAVSHGMVAASARSALVAELDPDPDRVAAVAAVLKHLDVTQVSPIASVLAAEAQLAAVAARPEPCPPDVAARLLLSLTDVTVRDALMATITRHQVRTGMIFWRDLTQCAPEGLAAPPATMYALCAYAVGDGARANVGIDRALADRPGYRMAELLDAGVSGGLPPDAILPELAAAAAEERERLLRRGCQDTSA